MSSICICGGGNLGHVIAGYLAAHGHEVHLLTRHPERFGGELLIRMPEREEPLRGRLRLVTGDAAAALDGASMVLLCLPGFAIAPVLEQLAPQLRPEVTVGSVFCSSGFFPMAGKILPEGTRLFGFQRVPFIARTIRYGHEAFLMGYRDHIFLATENIPDGEAFVRGIGELFGEKADRLDSYLEVTLTNSNPLLHPSRLYGMFGQQEEKDHHILFYEEWDERSSEVLIRCDGEFQRLREALGIPASAIPTLLEHYESHDARSLTEKISHIPSLKGILAPMLEVAPGRFVPDYSNRYFSEDIPYGMLMIKAYALRKGIPTPMIDEILFWAQAKMGKEFLRKDGTLSGKDISASAAPFI